MVRSLTRIADRWALLIFKWLCAILVMSVLLTSIFAEEKSEPNLKRALNRWWSAKSFEASSKGLLERVKTTAWGLLAGEIAASPELTLSSGAFDILRDSVADLDEIVTLIESDPAAARDLSLNTDLALRLDAAIARREEVVSKRDLSRKSELERLHQLREMNSAYRDLVRRLLVMNTHMVLGHSEELKQSATEASGFLELVEKTAGERKDFYLFQDEPRLDEESQAEVALVKSLADPLAPDVKYHHSAIQSLMLSRIATTANGDLKLKLLEESNAIASSIPADDAGLGVMAQLALGVCQRELGRIKTQADPLSQQAHLSAQDNFSRSKEAFEKATSLATTANADQSIQNELIHLLEELKSDSQILAQAAALTNEGRISEANERLEYCASIHFSPSVALALVETQLRLALISDDSTIEMVVQIPPDYDRWPNGDEFALLKNRADITLAWKRLWSGGMLPSGEKDAEALFASFSGAKKELMRLMDSDVKRVRPQAIAYLSLCDSGLMALSPEKDGLSKSYELLPTALEDIAADLDNVESFEALRLHEALIVGRMAQGYLAMRFAPNYRDTAQLAFASASDLAAKLPYSLDVLRFLGSPAVTALFQRSDASGSAIIQEERRLRQSLQRFVPVALLLNFDNGKELTEELTQIAEDVNDPQKSQSQPLNLEPQDPGDIDHEIKSQTRLLRAVSLMKSDKPEQAWLSAQANSIDGLTLENLVSMPVGELDKRVDGIHDPFELVILGITTEAYAVETPSLTPARMAELVQLAKRYFNAADRILRDSPGTQRRLTFLATMISEGHARLVAPDYFLEQGASLLSAYRYSEARKVFESGLRRHPHSQELEDAYLGSLLSEAELNPQDSQAIIGDALHRIERSTQQSESVSPSRLLRFGQVYEVGHQDENARQAYQRVLTVQPSSEEAVEARTRLVRLNLRASN